MPSTKQITQLLRAWSEGDQAAPDELAPLVYDELRRRAHLYMRRERKGHTLQTGALINEAYIRLIEYPRVQWKDRAHFFAMASHLMRRVLVDYARNRRSRKRGGDAIQVTLGDLPGFSSEQLLDVIALDEALGKLGAIDVRKCQVFEMRFFGGLSNEEIGAVLGVSRNTVSRDWTFSEVWLRRELTNAR
jgi:RNA polymerase sigma-70 factor (ECF subfamily)